ncbi:hypothetical protein H012_gp491 [Acanthamoeba polyphaga moumouvirus]|uniref:Uncharacterized protein n=1 Tax=Acanthamoeba polyphaga moumouvirus TaxID=1269028 RepID=L7RBR4_9VIRU|nr:hypothetical protein H012_gp491 [Acanthamoeba polyphaga moumouvirus]AGC01969.1 hypothetical protein Moumou_00433 [Acanthamoeba polyphaga moumouvirus]
MAKKDTGFYVIIALILLILAYWFWRNYMANRENVVVNNQTYQVLQSNIRSLNQQLLFLKQQISNLHVPIPDDVRNNLTRTVNNINQQVAALNNQVQVFLPKIDRNQLNELGQTLTAFNTNAMDLNTSVNNLLNQNISLFRYTNPNNVNPIPNNNVNMAFNQLHQNISSLQNDTTSLAQALSHVNPQSIPANLRNELTHLIPNLNQKIAEISQRLPNIIQQLSPSQHSILNNLLTTFNNGINALNRVLAPITHQQLNAINI